jgi:tetratricopeptide (TPR) repeat protein
LAASQTGGGTEAVAKLEAYNRTDEGRSDWRGFAAVGRIYKDSLMLSQAVPALKKAKELAPLEENGRSVRAEITADLAIVYFSLQQKKQATDTAKEAQQLAPDDAAVQIRLAAVAFSAKDYETAAKGAEQAVGLLLPAIRNNPLKRETCQLLSNCYRLQVELAQQQIEMKQDDSMGYIRLADALRQGAEVNRRITLLDAHDAVKQALVREPEKPDYLVLAAILEADLGAVDEAREKVDRVLKSSPENRQALELRERLNIVGAAPSGG